MPPEGRRESRDLVLSLMAAAIIALAAWIVRIEYWRGTMDAKLAALAGVNEQVREIERTADRILERLRERGQ